MNVLILTSCTGQKRHKVPNQLTLADFQRGIDEPAYLEARQQELAPWRLPAHAMYVGRQQTLLMEGLTGLRAAVPDARIDLFIVSAGYGLLSEQQEIVPYNATFADMSSRYLEKWAGRLQLKQRVQALLDDGGYQLVFFLLGDRYLQALALPLPHADQRLIVLAGEDSGAWVPRPRTFLFATGFREAESFGGGLVGLKGQIIRLLAQVIQNRGPGILAEIYREPQSLMTSLLPFRRPLQSKLLQGAGATERPIFRVARTECAANFGRPLRYFIPEWDDRVDPGFDFLHDRPSANRRDPYLDDRYAHELYPEPNYDGLLVSRATIEKSVGKKRAMEPLPPPKVHTFNRWPVDRPVMGDCGAWDYVRETLPPFKTGDMLRYYDEYGFDYGVSIDHLVLGPWARDRDEALRRCQLTRDNAEQFMRLHREGGYRFTPIGAAQGYDPDSYRDAVADLIDMGYKYIALGGMAVAPSTEIFAVLKAIYPLLPEDVDVHVFGYGRVGPLQAFRQLGMTSLDSSSPLRRAWLSSRTNYYTLEGRMYPAIRVPDPNERKVRLLIELGQTTLAEATALEKQALQALRAFDADQIGLDAALEAVMAYDRLVTGSFKHRDLYEAVLLDRPWRHCHCAICRTLGIEVILFRGNNRNRRRGFHNTYVFYRRVQERLRQATEPKDLYWSTDPKGHDVEGD